jgi:hypothetical protein
MNAQRLYAAPSHLKCINAALNDMRGPSAGPASKRARDPHQPPVQPRVAKADPPFRVFRAYFAQPVYMPPECSRPKGQSPRGAAPLNPELWDVYSLGLILYFLWTKREPFAEEISQQNWNAFQLMVAVLQVRTFVRSEPHSSHNLDGII